MRARYRIDGQTPAEELSTTITALQIKALLPSHRAFGKQYSSRSIEQISNPYLSALPNASQHQRTCKIVISLVVSVFTQRYVIIIPIFRTLAVPYLSENFVEYRPWDELGKLQIHNGGIRHGKENVCVCMLAGKPDRHPGSVSLSSEPCTGTNARTKRSRRTRRHGRSRRPDCRSD
jgi:hypothetical protein